MSTRIWLDLDDYGMGHAEFVDWVRGGLGGEFVKVADDIEKQLPKPLPSEPTGDVLVRDGLGVIWWRLVEWGWGCYGSPRQYRWAEVVKQQPVTVYRPEPSPERIEELIRKHLNRWCDDGDVVQATLRGFVADLLGGA
jgi:hypothetical protein